METFLTDLMRGAEDSAKVILGAGPEALTVVITIIVGYIAKAAPINNKWIPLISFVVGPAFYYAISNPGDQPPDLRFPAIRQIGIGFIMSAAAWMLYETVVRKYIEPILLSKKPKTDTEP